MSVIYTLNCLNFHLAMKTSFQLWILNCCLHWYSKKNGWKKNSLNLSVGKLFFFRDKAKDLLELVYGMNSEMQ